jgi:hypothetical protein
MSDWIRRIEEYRKVSLQSDFLNARADAESAAKELLNSKSGKFSKEDLDVFLTLCNTEKVPPDIHTHELRDKVTNTRFQLSFIGANKKSMIESLDACNKWISILWKTTDNIKHIDEFWKYDKVKGAGVGLPTMILYLKDSNNYNVWIPFLNKALEIYVGRKLETTRNWKNYREYNNTLNRSLRNLPVDPPLKPQEIDYILYRIGRG